HVSARVRGRREGVGIRRGGDRTEPRRRRLGGAASAVVGGHRLAVVAIYPGGITGATLSARRRASRRGTREAPMIRLKEIGHVLLRVLDLERARKFYELLGFRVLEEDPEHGGTFMALEGQSHAIDLFPVKDLEAAQRQAPGVRGLGHIAFRVESEAALRDAYAALREHGVEIPRPVDHVSHKAI